MERQQDALQPGVLKVPNRPLLSYQSTQCVTGSEIRAGVIIDNGMDKQSA